MRARVFLNKDVRKELSRGHPWVYANEIDRQDSPEDGDLVDVFYHSNQFLGVGYFNSSSVIRVRLLSRSRLPIDTAFFKMKIERAAHLRRKALPGRRSIRIVYAESDGLPGLIVDKFSDYLVMQVSTLGMSRLKDLVVDALVKVVQPKAIYEKTDVSFLEKEGLEETHEWLYKSGPILIPFEMHGLKLLADLKGQKTGFFLDQAENALRISALLRDRRVIDVFSYTGNFSIHALNAGASSCELVDSSERALAVAKEIMKMNGFEDKASFVNENAFDYLREAEQNSLDSVMIDPPSLIKSRASLGNALRGYKELNLRGIKALKAGGILATSSCSQLVPGGAWKRVVEEAFEDNKSIGQQLLSTGQPPDHPVMTAMPESKYLKAFVFAVSPLGDF